MRISSTILDAFGIGRTSRALSASQRNRVVGAAAPIAAVCVLLAWSRSNGGFAPTAWYAGGLVTVGLLAVVLGGGRARLRSCPRPVLVALGSFAVFTAWSFASIGWAADKGVAWDGANRTLLYLLLFAVVVLSRLDGRQALFVVGTWTLGVLGLAVWVLLALPASIGPGSLIQAGGVAAPTGYVDAQACLFLMGAWSAFVLSSRSAAGPVLRGVFAAGVVVLVDVALLSDSRGSLIAAALSFALLLAAIPHRVRSLLAVAPVALGLGLTAPRVVTVTGDLGTVGGVARLEGLAHPVAGGALLAGLLAALAAYVDIRRPFRRRSIRRLRRGVGELAVAGVVLGVAAFVIENPVSIVDGLWRSFKQPVASTAPGAGILSGGLGGARYDYYRVALNLFLSHPLRGLGADNFASDYARLGRSIEFPAYVHSLPLRMLVHTGLVGAMLAAGAFGAALLAVWRAVRVSGYAAAAAAAATMGVVQWAAQGSADWFWEFPALGGAAAVLLGLACGQAPRRQEASRAAGFRGRGLLLSAGLAASAASFMLPWVSALEVRQASQTWQADPQAALLALDRAGAWNPLNTQPALTEGTIAIRLRRYSLAQAAFERALERDGQDSYAVLALGVIASSRGQRGEALRLLDRASSLNPHDYITQGILARLRAGRSVSPADLIALIETGAQGLAR